MLQSVPTVLVVVPWPVILNDIGVELTEKIMYDGLKWELNLSGPMKRSGKYRIVASTNTCYYSENQIFYSLE